MHQRGCGGEPNRLARFYHAGETGDFERVLEHCLARAPGAALHATGFSLGGNILLKWLGETGDASTLRGAVAVSVPFRLDVGARRLERGLSRLYQRHLVGSMKRSVERKRQRMAYPVDADALAACRTFAQIDTCLTAPLHGFRDAWDYYARSSSRQFLPGIRTPSLVLHACDDPFLTPEAVPGANELPPDVTLELSEHGGHCGFVAGSLPLRPRYWLDHRIPAQILGPAAASD
jgi:hypothetical protein